MTITMQTAWSAFMAGNGAWTPVANALAAMPIAESAPVWLGVQNNAAILAEELSETGGVDFLAVRHAAQESRRLRAQILGASVLSKDFSTALKVTGVLLRAHFDRFSFEALQGAAQAQKHGLVHDDPKATLIAEKTLQGDFVLFRQGEMIGEVVPTENGRTIGDSVATILNVRFRQLLSKTPIPAIEIAKGATSRLVVFPHTEFLGVEAALFNGRMGDVRQFHFWDVETMDFNTMGVVLLLMDWIGIPI